MFLACIFALLGGASWLSGRHRSVMAATTPSCDAAAFASLTLDGIEIQSLDASVYTGLVPSETERRRDIHETTTSTDGCFLTINYTHLGQGDAVTTWVGLPLDTTSWNGNFLMHGGGGWLAGSIPTSVVGSGFASAATNGGHEGEHHDMPDWGLLSNGSINLPALEDFASRALVEAMRFGKLATEMYYGAKPTYSYWNGCSTGGRQGHVMAELVPEEFDGIMAGAPAISWSKLLVLEAWGYAVANDAGLAPPPCVFDAFTSAAIEACDELDGVEDGVISLPGLCEFDPSSLVGQTIQCSDLNGSVSITEPMAAVARVMWSGPEKDGQRLWFGLHHDSPLEDTYGDALLTSNCTTTDDCDLYTFPITQGWIQTFIQHRNSSSDPFVLTREDFFQAFTRSVAEYSHLIDFDNPDLSKLQASGTKMLVWHGMADAVIPANGTVDYYDRVAATMGDGVDDFYRLFLAPGVYHCGDGPGLDPSAGVFAELRAWVENGTVPETIAATGPAVAPGNVTATRTLNLCKYPKVLTFTGTDPNDPEHFTCV